MNKPRQHAALIKAWADGAEIEYLNRADIWESTNDPIWNPETKYRIKPEKEYPKSNLSYSDLCNIRTKAHKEYKEYVSIGVGEGWDTFLAQIVANEAVKRFIQDGEKSCT